MSQTQRRSQRRNETHVANGERERRLNRKRNRKNTDEGNKNKRSRQGDQHVNDEAVSNKSKQVNNTVRFLFNIPMHRIIIGLFFFLSRMILLHLCILNGGVGH